MGVPHSQVWASLGFGTQILIKDGGGPKKPEARGAGTGAVSSELAPNRNLGQVRPEAGGTGYLVSGLLTTWEAQADLGRRRQHTHSDGWITGTNTGRCCQVINRPFPAPPSEDPGSSEADTDELCILPGVLYPVTHLPFWVL